MDNRATTDRTPAANSTYPKGGVSCFADSFVVAESSVLRMKFSGKNPALRVAAKRYTTFWNEFKIDKYYEKDKTENNLSEFPEFISILH
jgi:hypothetical protein